MLVLNLGKQSVLCRSFLDGKLHKTWTESRVVYEKRDGSLWVNELGGKKKIVRQGDGSFLWEMRIYSIRGVSVQP